MSRHVLGVVLAMLFPMLARSAPQCEFAGLNCKDLPGAKIESYKASGRSDSATVVTTVHIRNMSHKNITAIALAIREINGIPTQGA